MSNLEVLLMKCDKCNCYVDSLIMLRENRKTKAMKDDSTIRNLKRVCLKCATYLSKSTKKRKPFYNFGEYWASILDSNYEVYYNKRTVDCK